MYFRDIEATLKELQQLRYLKNLRAKTVFTPVLPEVI